MYVCSLMLKMWRRISVRRRTSHGIIAREAVMIEEEEGKRRKMIQRGGNPIN